MTKQNDQHFIVASGLVKIYQIAGLEVVALQGLDLEVTRGEMLALVGPSGSGKSTFLSALGGLDRPSAGRLVIDGQNMLAFSASELTSYRRRQVGFVWQQSARNLLPYLSARENVELLMTLAGRSIRERRAWASELLAAVGMAEYASQKPAQLSGGQQQRVAIACALANQPTILLADEPTGEVDWATAQLILRLLRELRARYGLTIVLVTHDPRVAKQADRVIAIRDGRTSTEIIRTTEDERRKTKDENPSAVAEPSSFVLRPSSSQELVVLDSAGRLQLPGEQRALAGIGRRARIEVVEGGILIRPSDDEKIEVAAEAPTSTNGGDAVYHSLYNAEPPSIANGNKNGKAKWQFWRKRSK